MSGHCDFCGIWHSASCCHPGRAKLEELKLEINQLTLVIVTTSGISRELENKLTAANQKIERYLTEIAAWDTKFRDLWESIDSKDDQLKEKFDHHTKHVSQFLSDLYCTMIDPLVEGEMQIAPMMIALIDQAQKDRESLSQLTAANAKVEKLREAIEDYINNDIGRKDTLHNLELAFFDTEVK